MTKRGYVRVLSYSLFFVAVLGVWGTINYNASQYYKVRLESSYQQSLNSLEESLTSIESNLTKSVYSNCDSQLVDLSENLYAQTNTAIDSISVLPISQMNLSNTYKFLSQVSDYSKYLAEKLTNGGEITDEEHQQLVSLLNYCKKYDESVSEMVDLCNNGAEITEENVKSSSSNQKMSMLSTSFSSYEELFTDYPTLVYDGPFSDTILHKKPQCIINKDAITVEKGLKTAAKCLNVEDSEVTYKCEEANDIESYVYSCGKYTIAISKLGGKLNYILNNSTATSKKIDTDEAKEIAKKYLEEVGYSNMKDTYYSTANNICLINYAYTKDDVVYYADLIKVGVSLENGKIISFEASSYLTNHKSRNLNDKKITIEKATKNLSSYLTVLDSKECVIPEENGTEKYCYEFHCESKSTGEEVLVYLNTTNGKEEDILQLLYSDDGTFTR